MTLRNPWTCYLLLVAGLALGWSGCASPAKRISHQQKEFDTYPAEIQAKIRAGDVAVGFTAPQVKMALGDPDRILTRTTATGTSEVWVYGGKGSGLGFGFGLGMATGGSSAVGAGVGTGTDAGEEKMRVVFTASRVSSVERATK